MDGRNGPQAPDGSEAQQDTVTFEGGPTAGLPPPAVPELSPFAQSVNKLANVMLSSGFVAILRVFANPPKPPVPTNAEALPEWYLAEFASKTKYKLMARQYLRDTLLLTGSAYLMDWVDGGVKAIRGGKDDPLNRMLGGVAAGTVVGATWFPANPTSRAILATTGAAVGYISYAVEKTSQHFLLDQQQKLEKMVLGKHDDQLRTQPDKEYIRYLIKMRQEQLEQAAELIRARQGGEGAGADGSWAADSTGGGQGGPGPDSRGFAGKWATAGGAPRGGVVGVGSGAGRASRTDGSWEEAGPRDDAPAGPYNDSGDTAGAAASLGGTPAPARSNEGGGGFWGHVLKPRHAHHPPSAGAGPGPASPDVGGGRAAQQQTARSGQQPGEMQIYEEADVSAEDEMRLQAQRERPGALFIQEDQDAPAGAGTRAGRR